MGDRTKEHPYGTCEKCGIPITFQEDGQHTPLYERICTPCLNRLRRAQNQERRAMRSGLKR